MWQDDGQSCAATEKRSTPYFFALGVSLPGMPLLPSRPQGAGDNFLGQVLPAGGPATCRRCLASAAAVLWSWPPWKKRKRTQLPA